jgi:hypothetical protein
MFRELGFPVPWWTDLVVMSIALTALISCRKMTKRDWEALLETEWFSRVFGVILIVLGVLAFGMSGGLPGNVNRAPGGQVRISLMPLFMSFLFAILGLLYLVLGARFSRHQLDMQRFGMTTRDQLIASALAIVGGVLGICYLGWLKTGRFWPVLPD